MGEQRSCERYTMDGVAGLSGEAGSRDRQGWHAATGCIECTDVNGEVAERLKAHAWKVCIR
jgi:hypothetical protein